MFHRGNTQSSGKQHTWTTAKDVNEREVERQRQRDAQDPNKFNINIGASNQGHPQPYYGDNRGYHGSERIDNRGYYGPERVENRGYYGPERLDRSNLGTNVTTNTSTSYGYSQPFTKSDWDHYAVRHEDALIGDPIAYADNSLNPEIRRNVSRNHQDRDYDRNYDRNYQGDRGLHYMGQYDNDSARLGKNQNANTRNQLYTNSTNYEGPIAFDTGLDANGRPLKGNYASGSIIESGYHTRNGGGAWGAEPLWGSRGNDNLWRDYRDNRTPLLPENPWTHNELGREYLDGRRDHLYKHTDDAFVNSNNAKKYAMEDVHRQPNRNIAAYDVPRHETTRSFPGGFTNNSTVPQAPPLPHWNAHADNNMYRPKSFHKDHDYATFDPRANYSQTHTY